MANGDSLAIRVGGTVPSMFDSLHIGGNASLSGSLSVSLTGGFTLESSQSFTIVDVDGTASGSFAGLGEGALVGSFGGIDLFITYTGGNGNDVVLFTNFGGDFNLDGNVDTADYVVWRKTLGDINSYNTWRANFGRTSAAGTVATVPEPASVILCLLITVYSLRHRPVKNTRRHPLWDRRVQRDVR